MTLITKQLLMNVFNLPTVVIDIVKEYCFHEIEKITKKNKIKLHLAICSAELTRANDFAGVPDYTDNDPHWTFGYRGINKYGETIQLQAINCVDCGNYQVASTPILAKSTILCRCKNNPYLDYLEYFDYTDEEDFD